MNERQIFLVVIISAFVLTAGSLAGMFREQELRYQCIQNAVDKRYTE